MAQKARSILRPYFLPYHKPSPPQFEDVVDSAVNPSHDKSSIVEAEAGILDTKYLTPKTVKAAIKKLTPDASETVKGLIEIATIAEAENASELPLAVTPIAAKSAIEKYATVTKVNNISPVSGNITITNVTGTAGSISGNINKNQVTGLEDELKAKIVVMPANSITLTDDNSVQNTLASINLSANKSYDFKGRLILQKGNVNQHVVAFKFTAGTPSAVTSLLYLAKSFSSTGAGSLSSTSYRMQISGTTIRNLTTANNTNLITVIDFEGKVRCSASTTFAPQISFSTATGGSANMVKVGSYMIFKELGSNVVEKIGDVN